MKKHRLLWVFLGKFIAIYLVIIFIGLVGFNDSYANMFRSTVKSLYGSFKGGTGIVGVETHEDEEHPNYNTRLFLLSQAAYDEATKNKVKGAQIDLPSAEIILGTTRTGYIPLGLMIALILASPITLKRKLFALGAGLIAFHIWIYTYMYIWIWFAYNQYPYLDVGTLSGFAKDVLNNLYRILIVEMGPRYIVPVFIWFLVSFRKSDWQRFSGLIMGTKEEPSTSS